MRAEGVACSPYRASRGLEGFISAGKLKGVHSRQAHLAVQLLRLKIHRHVSPCSLLCHTKLAWWSQS